MRYTRHSVLSQLAVCLACLLLAGVLEAAAGVVWLSIGETGTPALDSEGTPLTQAALEQMQVHIYTDGGAPLGTADIEGLDQVEPGVFTGVIYVGELAAPGISLRLVDGARLSRAGLGAGTALLDDLAPWIDPLQHHVSQSTLTWEDIGVHIVNSHHHEHQE